MCVRKVCLMSTTQAMVCVRDSSGYKQDVQPPLKSLKLESGKIIWALKYIYDNWRHHNTFFHINKDKVRFIKHKIAWQALLISYNLSPFIYIGTGYR